MPTTTLEIHPAIGIARVGSSQEFYLGPEPNLPIETNRRDSTANKLLKRQAVRFRIYSCTRDDQGILTKCDELTPDKATITWTVSLVNRKSAAPRFLKNRLPNTDPSFRRNNATGNDVTDKKLVIDGGSQSLTGKNQAKKAFQGAFKSHAVPLGEISTDNNGRLIVVGGFGKAFSDPVTPLDDFADNDNWCDDTSDGPVDAKVQLSDGTIQKVDKSAWVISCQPDFAPGIGNLVTLYDAFIEEAITRSVISLPTNKPAYDLDVLPILTRALGYQWVNKFHRAGHTPGQSGDFFSIADLDDPAQAVPERAQLFNMLRAPSAAGNPNVTKPMPALFSDDYFSNNKLVQQLTRSQYRILEKWAAGQFTKTDSTRKPELEADLLTRTVLEACVGAAFCPGIEAGRMIRNTSIFVAKEVFRFDHSKLHAGMLTASMALPWQADFSDCRWETVGGVVPPGRGWWPAQRPDHVLRTTASATMDNWDRKANTKDLMVRFWDQLGIVLEKQDATGQSMFIETQRTLPE